MRATLRDALMARLLSESAWQQHPGHADVAVRSPIFVTGLPRTGTTALHRLLCADPAHQGLEMWLTQMPQPRPPRDTWAANPLYQRMHSAFAKHHVENPEFLGLHYMSADMVEECWRLLRQSMRSQAFESLAYLPTYSQWLQQQDWIPVYARHRRNLQLIGLADPDQRWVLKNPSHLFALDAVLAVYPEALIVQTHRDPTTAIASSSSLSAHASADQSELFTGDVIGRTQLELWARGADAAMRTRVSADPARFCDVRYDDFVRDPLGTVASVYAHFGLPHPDAARRAQQALHAESLGGAARPAHRYDLAGFGLTEPAVRDRFAAYSERHLA